VAVSLYRVASGPRTATRPEFELAPIEEVRFATTVDDGSTLDFAIEGGTEAADRLTELASDIWLYRLGIPVQRFRVVAMNQEWGPDGQDKVTISAVCYRRILAWRHVRFPLYFSSTSQGAIVWALVQHTQAGAGGDLGITLGDTGPTILVTREYETADNILRLIMDFVTEDDQMAWNIDADRALWVSTPTFFPNRPIPFKLGETAERLSRPSGADQFANAVWAVGDSLATVPAPRGTMDIGTDPRGRWEKVQSYATEKSQGSLDSLAAGFLFDTSLGSAEWLVTPVAERFFEDAYVDPGDFIKIARPKTTAFSTTQPALINAQVMSREIRQSTDGDVAVQFVAREVP